MIDISPGDKVLIIQDCREGGHATGQVGIYEGKFPLTAVIKVNDGVTECDYEDWLKHPLRCQIPQWEKGRPEPSGNYWYTSDNPRITLPDGSKIWGAECWWGPNDEAPPLPEAQKQLMDHKAALTSLLEEVVENAAKKKEDPESGL